MLLSANRFIRFSINTRRYSASKNEHRLFRSVHRRPEKLIRRCCALTSARMLTLAVGARVKSEHRKHFMAWKTHSLVLRSKKRRCQPSPPFFVFLMSRKNSFAGVVISESFFSFARNFRSSRAVTARVKNWDAFFFSVHRRPEKLIRPCCSPTSAKKNNPPP